VAKLLGSGLLIAVSAFLLACTEETAGTAAATTSRASSGDTASSGQSAAPEPPVLDTVAALHGWLHLFWTNVTVDCDAVEGERRLGEATDASFVQLFSLPGYTEDWEDVSATDGSETYTYRLRCTRGSELSGYSNEFSQSPNPLDAGGI
jgi:hypothetical protein